MQDKLGQEISAGSFVVAPRGLRDLAVCRVEKLNPKTITLNRVDGKSRSFLALPSEVILIDALDVLALKLK